MARPLTSKALTVCVACCALVACRGRAPGSDDAAVAVPAPAASDVDTKDSADVSSSDEGSDPAGVEAPTGTLAADLLACGALGEPQKLALIISIDGLRADAFVAAPERIPTLVSLRSIAASTLAATTDPNYSITLPNHTGMITGRTVLGDSGHRVTSNSDGSETLHMLRGAYTVSIFDVAHDRGLFTALVAAKSKFRRFGRSYNPGRPDRVDEDNGDNKIDIDAAFDQSDEAVAATASALLDVIAGAETVRARGALVFVHFKSADSAGHATGFNVEAGTPYLDAIARVDSLVSDLLVKVSDTSLCGITGVYITTDHGGTGLNHSDHDNPLNTTIPLLVLGPHAAPGTDLVELNPDEVVRNIAVGNLALAHLGLPSVEGSTVNVDGAVKSE